MNIQEAQIIVDRIREIRRDTYRDNEEVDVLKRTLVGGGYIYSASYVAIPNPYA